MTGLRSLIAAIRNTFATSRRGSTEPGLNLCRVASHGWVSPWIASNVTATSLRICGENSHSPGNPALCAQDQHDCGSLIDNSYAGAEQAVVNVPACPWRE